MYTQYELDKELQDNRTRGEESHDIDKEEEKVEKNPKSFADEAAQTAVKQLEIGLKARAARFTEIALSEAQYNGEKSKALRGRNNVPFDAVVARGFVDTLMSKIDEGLQISFERSPGREQDKKPAQKISAVCDFERGPDQGAWDLKDLGVKKLATFSGRGIYKKYASRCEGEFKDHFDIVDHWDFVTQPGGGGFLDKHKFKGQINLFMSRSEILDQVEGGYYDKRQAYKLFAATSGEQLKKNTKAYEQKMSRLASVGVDVTEAHEVGTKLYNVTEWVMYFRGEWYYLLFSYDTGLWLRFEPLEDVFSVAAVKPGRGPWVSWATHFDPFEFWSVAPMDSVRPIAVAMKKVLNWSLDNLEKRTWNHRAYDPNVFNPRDLLWKEDGLVKANVRPGGNIGNHVYTFETPDTTNITVNLVDFMNNFLGEKTGITPGAQGKSDDTKVGIYVGNIQQVADRLGLTNKMYEQAHIDIGVNFQYGLLDHMPERYAVKVIGNSGIEWNEELLRKEVRRKFSIRIRGTDTEERMNAVLSQRKENALLMVMKDQEMRQRVNPSWRVREVLTLGGYDQEDVRIALDTTSDADDDILAEAAQAIEDIITGKKPNKNRGATTGYIRKIVEFAYDTDIDEKTFKKLLEFAQLHIPIAQENAQRKVTSVIASRAIAGGATGAPTAQIEPGMSGGTPSPAMSPGALTQPQEVGASM